MVDCDAIVIGGGHDGLTATRPTAGLSSVLLIGVEY